MANTENVPAFPALPEPLHLFIDTKAEALCGEKPAGLASTLFVFEQVPDAQCCPRCTAALMKIDSDTLERVRNQWSR